MRMRPVSRVAAAAIASGCAASLGGAVLIDGHTEVTSGATVSVATDGRYRTTLTDPSGSIVTVEGESPLANDFTVTPKRDAAGRITGMRASGEVQAAALTGPLGAAATGSSDLSCGGTAPLRSPTFSGTVKSGDYVWGNFEGALIICKDAVGPVNAFVLDKMWMRAKGRPWSLTHPNVTIPDTFWVQSYAHSHIDPQLLGQDKDGTVSDSAGGCTQYSVGLSGSGASVGMSGEVCRGTMSPIMAHAVSVGGVDSTSYGTKYEGKNLLMDGTTTYAIKSVGYRKGKKYSDDQPYANIARHGGYRWFIDFDCNGGTAPCG